MNLTASIPSFWIYVYFLSFFFVCFNGQTKSPIMFAIDLIKCWHIIGQCRALYVVAWWDLYTSVLITSTRKKTHSHMHNFHSLFAFCFYFFAVFSFCYFFFRWESSTILFLPRLFVFPSFVFLSSIFPSIILFIRLFIRHFSFFTNYTFFLLFFFHLFFLFFYLYAI